MTRRSLLLIGLAAGCAGGGAPSGRADPDLLAWDTGDTGRDPGALADATPITLSGLRVRLRWTPGTAVYDVDGARFTTDRGYGVHLVEGYLVSAHATLVPCERVEASRTAAGAAAPMNHGTFDDPSAILTAVAEPLHQNNPEGVVFGESSFEATDYCGAHYLVATDLNGTGDLPLGPWPPLSAPSEGADTGAEGDGEEPAAEEAVAERWSLRLRGELTAPDGATSPLLIEGAGATGELWALSALAGAEGCGPRAELQIDRRLDTLLDGLDLDAEPADALSAGLLLNLIAGAEARLAPQAAPR
jgi:hypothetical protein